MKKAHLLMIWVGLILVLSSFVNAYPYQHFYDPMDNNSNWNLKGLAYDNTWNGNLFFNGSAYTSDGLKSGNSSWLTTNITNQALISVISKTYIGLSSDNVMLSLCVNDTDVGGTANKCDYNYNFQYGLDDNYYIIMENDADTPRVLCRKNVFSAGYVEIEFKRFANYSWDIIADGVSLGCPTTYASSLKNWTNFSIIALGMRDEGQMDWLNVTSNMLPPDSLEIYLNSPPNNTINNTVPYFYYNITNTGVNVSNCSLWTNQTGSWEARIYNATAVPNATNTYFGIGLPSDGDYLWNVQCIDTNSSEYWGDNNWTFIYDTNAPTYITNFVNNSVYYRNNLTAQFNLSDENLIHSYNISIDGVEIAGNESYNVQSLNLSLNYDISNLSVGAHELKLRFADGHTANNLLTDYDTSKCLFGDCLKYDFSYPYKKGSIIISQKEADLFDNWETEKKRDRYTFKFEPYRKKDTYTFLVELDGKFDIVSNNKYGQWIVYNEH